MLPLARVDIHNHQVWKNAPPEGGSKKFRSMGHEDSTVATWLQSGGYRTVLLGKYLNGYSKGDDETYAPSGWDEWYGKLDGDGYYDYQTNENGTVVSYGSDEQDYYTDVLAEKARDYVRRAARPAIFSSPGPFFMYLVAPATPHGPFVPTPRHEDAWKPAPGSLAGRPKTTVAPGRKRDHRMIAAARRRPGPQRPGLLGKTLPASTT